MECVAPVPFFFHRSIFFAEEKQPDLFRGGIVVSAEKVLQFSFS